MRTLPVVRTLAALALLVALPLGAARRAGAADAPAAPPVSPVEPVPPTPAAPPPALKADAWRDVEVVDRALTEAVAAVEAACGTKFATRPTVRVSTARDVADALEAIEVGLDLKPRSERSAVRAVARAMFAFTDYTTNTIHVVPDNVERMATERRSPALVGTDVLRVVLVHEATHALDWARWGWVAHRKTLGGTDALQAFSAVAEGHAQLVAEDVAVARGLRAAFDTMTLAIVSVPDGLDPAMRALTEAVVAEAAFGYVAGHRFLRAVRDARGPAGVEAALRSPPIATRVIEQPQRFLAGTGPGGDVEIDLELLLSAFEPLVADPRWRVQRDRARRAALGSQGTRLPEARRAGFLAGYEDGRILAAALPRGAQVFVIVLRFATVEDAAAFVRDDRDLGKIGEDEAMRSGVEVLSSAYEEGAGAEGGLAGYRYVKRLKVPDGETLLVGGDVVVGTCVASVTAVNAPWLAADVLAAAVDRFATAVLEPEAARKAVRRPAVPVPPVASDPLPPPAPPPAPPPPGPPPAVPDAPLPR